jgi:catechol 2,3-dioxygenase-like lactoylglutathione lyase family enzyme
MAHPRSGAPPVHVLINVDVDDLEKATDFYRKAFGLKLGRQFGVDDPFGHGFCLLQFLGRGYDEIAS